MSPQTSKLRFALTAAGCACAGFGVVWASLAVRGMLRGADAPARVERPDLAAEPEPVPSPIAAAAPLATARHWTLDARPSPAPPAPARSAWPWTNLRG